MPGEALHKDGIAVYTAVPAADVGVQSIVYRLNAGLGQNRLAIDLLDAHLILNLCRLLDVPELNSGTSRDAEITNPVVREFNSGTTGSDPEFLLKSLILHGLILSLWGRLGDGALKPRAIIPEGRQDVNDSEPPGLYKSPTLGYNTRTKRKNGAEGSLVANSCLVFLGAQHHRRIRRVSGQRRR
jgi:hypothetical protein